MRTAYLGTSDFAATVLRRLAGSAHRPHLCVTPPDRPRGRGRRPTAPPVAATARELGIEVLQTERIDSPDLVSTLLAGEPDAICVCAFGQIIREPLLSGALLLNVHPSLLPRWRGAAPIERAIMACDERTGVTIMRVTEGLDSGPVALQRDTPIGGEESYGDLAARLAELGGELLLRALDLHAEGGLELTDQAEEGATYAEKISPEERLIDPAMSAPELAARVRALTPHVGAYVALPGGERLGVREARADTGRLSPGRLESGEGMRLGCAEGVLRLEVVQPPGGKAMSAEAYALGHRLPDRVADSGGI